jgi:outer membrane protein OmpA-like peptidoglycan-associated protein
MAVPDAQEALDSPDEQYAPGLLLPARVAASELGADFNAIRFPLLPGDCWTARDVHFRFGSSFPVPALQRELARLAQMLRAQTGCRVSIFGHTDSTGAESYNKELSGRRAHAIQALLTRDVAAWNKLCDSPLGDDRWDPDAVTQMRSVVGGDGMPRAQLFKAYMDRLCGDLRLGQQDFLAGGADAGGKGDVQGCGEFNPALVFSADDAAAYQQDHEGRDRANAPNRRVLVLLFPAGPPIETAHWPCPRVSEGTQGCRKRFWSDAAKRLANGAQQRLYRNSHDTFACRFYDRLTRLTDCEGRMPKGLHQYFAWIPPALHDGAILTMREPDKDPVLKTPVSAAPVDGNGYSVFDLGNLDLSKQYLIELRVDGHRISMGTLTDLTGLSPLDDPPQDKTAGQVARIAGEQISPHHQSES